MPEPADITQLLALARSGDPAAENTLFEMVYAQLRQRAHSLLRGESQAAAISSGTLVHEAFLKLFRSGSGPKVQDRAHFYLVAARAMRQVIIERARKRSASKRCVAGGHIPFDEMTSPEAASPLSIDDVIAIANVCDKLTVSKPAWGQVVELHFFGGLRIVEMAEILGVSEVTIGNRLNLAKAFLHREMTGAAGTAHASGQ